MPKPPRHLFGARDRRRVERRCPRAASTGCDHVSEVRRDCSLSPATLPAIPVVPAAKNSVTSRRPGLNLAGRVGRVSPFEADFTSAVGVSSEGATRRRTESRSVDPSLPAGAKPGLPPAWPSASLLPVEAEPAESSEPRQCATARCTVPLEYGAQRPLPGSHRVVVITAIPCAPLPVGRPSRTAEGR